MRGEIEPKELRTIARFRARHGTDIEVLRGVCDAVDAALADAGFGREPEPSAPLWLPFRDSVGCWRAATHAASPAIFNVFVSPQNVCVRGRRPGTPEDPPDDHITRELLASVHRGLTGAPGIEEVSWCRRDELKKDGAGHSGPFDPAPCC